MSEYGVVVYEPVWRRDFLFTEGTLGYVSWTSKYSGASSPSASVLLVLGPYAWLACNLDR